MSNPRIEPTLDPATQAPAAPAQAAAEPALEAAPDAPRELLQIPVEMPAEGLRVEASTPSPAEAEEKPVGSLGFWGWLGLLWIIWVTLVFGPVVALKWLPPPTTAFMLQSETQPVRYIWVPRDEIAEVMRKAVVAAEDQKFWDHPGFDIEAMEKAYTHNQKVSERKRGRIRGASTISQQTAKNLFLWPGGGYFRKGVEAGFTILIERIWGKERILEVYLNVAELGPGIYGVEAASRTYFKKHASQLTPEEAARLVAILPSPRRYQVVRPGPYVQKRVNWVLHQMGYGRRSAEPEPEPIDPTAAASDETAEAPAPQLAPGAEPETPGMTPWTESEPAGPVEAPAEEPAADPAPEAAPESAVEPAQ